MQIDQLDESSQAGQTFQKASSYMIIQEAPQRISMWSHTNFVATLHLPPQQNHKPGDCRIVGADGDSVGVYFKGRSPSDEEDDHKAVNAGN